VRLRKRPLPEGIGAGAIVLLGVATYRLSRHRGLVALGAGAAAAAALAVKIGVYSVLRRPW